MDWLHCFKQDIFTKNKDLAQPSTFQNLRKIHGRVFIYHWTSKWQMTGTYQFIVISAITLQNTLKNLPLHKWDENFNGVLFIAITGVPRSLWRRHPQITLNCIPMSCDAVSVLRHVQPPWAGQRRLEGWTWHRTDATSYDLGMQLKSRAILACGLLEHNQRWRAHRWSHLCTCW